MKSACSLCLLLMWVVLVREGASVISFPRDRGQLEPRTVEVAEGEDPVELLEKGTRRLHKRQSSSNSNGIGTRATLSGDGHNQAVVHWTGHPSEVIFIVTRERTSSGRGRSAHSSESWLWRSTDYGHHFENETYKLQDSDAVIEWYYISSMQNNLIFADRSNKRLYVTTDEGDNYTRVDIPFQPDRLVFQSSSSPNVTDGDIPLYLYVLGYDASNKTLWVSSDVGSTWTLLGEDVTPGRYYWRVMNTTIEGDLTTVYFETAINSTHAQLHYSVYPYSTHDVFDSSLGPFLINSFVLTHEYMFVQRNASVGGNYQSPLWVSHYRKPFRQARFPLQTPEMHYSVVDASEGQVFIAVYHTFNNTNLYLSEEQGLNYSLSLEYIISPPESDWINGYPSFDVHVVEGIVGTYIANRKTPGSQYGATVISFDKGGAWNFLTPPAVTSGGTPIICLPPQCSLHLHMNSDRVYGYQSILSQDSAIGLIMAQGNLGPALQRYNYNIQRLYFSHDGGFTWQEVAQRFWQFQFAALGSIVVTVQMYQRNGVDHVRWSCDEGASWNETSFVDSSIRVVGILTERGEKARHVTVFGSTPRTSFEWLVVDLNFTSVVPDQCIYPHDYYQWIPTDERPGSRCLLGEVITYERRESEVCCFVDPEYDKPTTRTYCECAIEDFECDFGFERVNLNSPCTPLPYLSWPPSPPTDCHEGGNYTYTSGYRRVAGDRCVPGNETYFLPITKQCPVVAPRGLFLLYSPQRTPPGVNVTFTLTQLLGWRMATEYRWYFDDGTSVVTVTGYDNGHTQSHVFHSHGTYHVNVTVTNAAGSSQAFADVTVVEDIQGVEVATRPTVRSSILTMVNVTVRTDGGELYTGPLRLIAQHQNGTELDSNYWKNSNGSEQLHIALSNPGNSTVMFTASNGIFVRSTTSVFLVVTRGQYGAVTLVFRTADLPDNYDTPEWEMMLVNSIISYIQQQYKRSVQFIEVVALRYYNNVTLETNSPHSLEHGVLKRSGERLLTVDVDILPANSSDISASIAVAEQLVGQIQSGGLNVSVNGRTVAVANATLRSSTQQILIVEPNIAEPNTELYIGLGLGLGLGLIALVVFSTVMVIVTYYYRRKYSRLHVRYSRLQQGPVRFTFTEHGETVEEEDFAENLSDDDPTYANDQKLEKIAPLPGAMES